MSDWPLSNICEPHETNDVLLLLKDGKTIATDIVTEQEEGKGQYYEGNQRFLELLRSRQDDYRQKSPMEKPLVALDLLQQWRSQSPPGRFLVAQDKDSCTSTPALWKDVGDKEARSRISKVLKHMSSSETSSENILENGAAEKWEQAKVTTPLDSHASMERHGPDVTLPRSVLLTTSIPIPAAKPLPQLPIGLSLPQAPLKDLGGRRVSAQLRAANVQGKLYGRWDERDQLLKILKCQIRDRQDKSLRSRAKSFNHQASVTSTTSSSQEKKLDLVLISGGQGVGKTALARTLKNPRTSTDDDEEAELDSKPSFFLECDFEKLMNPNPYKAYVTLFEDFCQQLFEDNNTELIEQCQEAMNKAFDDDRDTLLGLIPAFQKILRGDSESIPDPKTFAHKKMHGGSGVMMAQKIKGYLVLLLETISSLVPWRPVVILLNDLHWASEASMDILTTIISDITIPSAHSSIIFMATIEDCQEPKLYFKRAIEKLAASENIQLHEIQVQNLKESDVRDFLADTLDLEYGKILALAPIMYSLTQGSPVFLTEFLRKMQFHGFLYTNQLTGEFEYDIDKIKNVFQGVKTIHEMIRMKIHTLPNEIQKTMMYVACLGSTKFDSSMLELVEPDAVSHLEIVAKMGMLKKDNGCYRFFVDRVIHEIYNMIPLHERPSLHLRLAQKLWQHLDERKDKEFLFILLNQLMLGDGALTQDGDRHAVASLCLQAGASVAKTLGFQTAWIYLDHGISILPKDKLWGRDNYDLSLRLHNAAIEVCYCNSQFEVMDRLVQEVLEHSRIFHDSLLARSMQVVALGTRHQLDEAIDSALATLKQLGESFPSSPRPPLVIKSFLKTKRMLQGRSDESILGLKPIRDCRKLAAMKMMNSMYLYTFFARPYLACLVALRMVQITLESGVCELSAVAFCCYAELLVG